jgi:hypothetical protein
MQMSAMRISAVWNVPIHRPNMPYEIWTSNACSQRETSNVAMCTCSCTHVMGLKMGRAIEIMTEMSCGGMRCALATPQMV